MLEKTQLWGPSFNLSRQFEFHDPRNRLVNIVFDSRYQTCNFYRSDVVKMQRKGTKPRRVERVLKIETELWRCSHACTQHPAPATKNTTNGSTSGSCFHSGKGHRRKQYTQRFSYPRLTYPATLLTFAVSEHPLKHRKDEINYTKENEYVFRVGTFSS